MQSPPNRVPRLRRWRLQLLALSLVCFSWQGSLSQELPRKAISKKSPTVPELARKLHLMGNVKLELVVAPDGAVTSAKMLGGSPVFEECAVQAAKQWRFERAEKETKEEIVMQFQLH
jgi:TonB family protein